MIGTELTIGRWLADRARLTPDRVAIRFLGAELTYADLDRSATRLAAGLAERGMRRGDRLATLTRTSPDHVATLFACARLGVALQPISWRLAPAEIAYQLEDAEPTLLLASEDHAELARKAGTDVEIERIGDPTLETDGEVEDVARDEDPLLLVYTSGTTGKPKGALLTHANCFWTNLSFDRTTSLRDDDVVLQVLPQFHVGGWNVQPLLAWWKGATVVLEPSFDPARALQRSDEAGRAVAHVDHVRVKRLILHYYLLEVCSFRLHGNVVGDVPGQFDVEVHVSETHVAELYGVRARRKT